MDETKWDNIFLKYLIQQFFALLPELVILLVFGVWLLKFWYRDNSNMNY